MLVVLCYVFALYGAVLCCAVLCCAVLSPVDTLPPLLLQQHSRDGGGSGGIVSQMKASIESKAKAKSGSPRGGAQTNTKQKINVSNRTRVLNFPNKIPQISKEDSSRAPRRLLECPGNVLQMPQEDSSSSQTRILMRLKRSRSNVHTKYFAPPECRVLILSRANSCGTIVQGRGNAGLDRC